MLIMLAVLVLMGVFDVGSYITPGSEVRGFNTFSITHHIFYSNGSSTIVLVNMLEDTVIVTDFLVDGTSASSSSPAMPFNLTAGGNVTFNAVSSLTGSPGGRYSAKISVRFDVIRGTADHYEAGTLNGLFVPA